MNVAGFIDTKYIYFYVIIYMGKKPQNGIGTFTYSDGSVYTGNWKNGKQHGTGTFEQGGAKYVGDFVNNMFEGKGTLTKFDGSSYVGDFVRDQFEGNGNLIRSNGEKYDGEFKNGKLHGNGTYTWMNGDIYQGYWKDGKPNGSGKMTSSDGTVTAGIWVNGKFTEEYPKLKVTKSAFNDCDDIFSMERMVTGDIIVLHNQTVEQDMFDTNTTIGDKQNTRNICPYMFLKSNFDEYIKTKNTNPNTREPMTEENCKTYILHIVDDGKSKSSEKSKFPNLKSRTSEKSKSPTRNFRTMSWGGKRIRRYTCKLKK